MYKTFFKLVRNPFEITPDPSFLFPTRRHSEALASLYYGVRRHKGFVVMTGEVGTGKTLLIRCVLQLLKRSEVSFAYVFNSRLSSLDFLQYVATDLGLKGDGSRKTKGELLFNLSSYLAERHKRKLTTLLVVDEAHHLSGDVLEEIRLLTNIETAEQKLLQILLVGQPELDHKLDSSDLRQLKQRIALRCHLQCLNEGETAGYIRARLTRAGANSRAVELFPDATIALVHHYSRGIPRVINSLSENAMLNAYAQQARIVTPEIVEEAAVDLRLQVATEPVVKVIDSHPASDKNEVWQAAKALLQLNEYLQSARQREQSVVTVAPLEKVHEPYI